MARKSVLIADDDRALAQALAIRCKTLGLNVKFVHDGMDAYNAICKTPPDLLILDIGMPSVTGLHLCDELTRDHRLAPIPVIILTGKSDEATVQRCELLGAHYVWKGLNTWDQLKPVICELLELDDGAGPPRVTPPESAGQATPQTVSHGVKLLVIDDDPDVSKALQIKLRPYGVEVLRAFNGMQGYWTALKEKPACIITDFAMPDGPGDYVLRRLQEHSVTRKIPVIVVSGRITNSRDDCVVQRQLRSLGAQALLTKPIDFDALLRELGRHIRLAAPAASKT